MHQLCFPHSKNYELWKLVPFSFSLHCSLREHSRWGFFLCPDLTDRAHSHFHLMFFDPTQASIPASPFFLVLCDRTVILHFLSAHFPVFFGEYVVWSKKSWHSRIVLEENSDPDRKAPRKENLPFKRKKPLAGSGTRHLFQMFVDTETKISRWTGMKILWCGQFPEIMGCLCTLY